MNNIMTIGDQRAIINYDPDIEMFRGEFIGLNGGADFYADNIADLHREGQLSLNVFLDECNQAGIEPYKRFSGKFNVRISPAIHEHAVEAAAARGLSLNQFVAEAIQQEIREM